MAPHTFLNDASSGAAASLPLEAAASLAMSLAQVSITFTAALSSDARVNTYSEYACAYRVS